MTARSDTRCHACGRSLPQWTKAQIVDAMRQFSATHGRAPVSTEWHRAAWNRPSKDAVIRRFGTWGAGVEAAGLVPPYRKDVRRWSRDEVIRAIWDWREETGELPRQTDWPRSTDRWPGYPQARRLFGSWNRAIVAAGYEPRRAKVRSRVAA